LGSSNSDTVSFNARVNSDIDPSTDNTYDLGRNAHAWRNLYLTGTANIAALSASGTTTLSGLTASTALALNASKQVVSVTNTGTGDNVLATSPTLVTPALGTPSSATLTNATGLPVSTGISGLGAGVATFLATPSSANLAAAVTDETGTGALVFANSPTLVTPALGTPASGVVTNLTGTASININGTVGATTASTGAFTDVTTSGTVTHNGGTANGVAFLNSSKVLTTGSALTFDGTALAPDGTGRTLGTSSLRWGTVFATAFADGADQLLGSSGAQVRIGYGSSWTSQAFAIGGSEQMRLTSTGLGIGTSSPTAKLNVAASNGLFGVANGNTAGGMKLQAFNAAGNADGYLAFEGFTKEYGRFDSSGNLGLGVTPSAWGGGYGGIQINNAMSLWSANGAGAQYSANVYFDGSVRRYVFTGTAAEYQQSGGVHAWSTAPSGTAGDAISFTQALTLTADGNLVAGATTAAARIVSVGSNATVFKALILRNSNGSDGSSATIDFETSSGTQGDEASMAGRIAGLRTGSGTTGALTFSTTNAGVLGERARIDSSGNLGLGVTPSAWDGKALQISNGAALWTTNTLNTRIGNNVYSSSTGERYLNTGAAAYMSINDAGNGFAWKLASSGTAGNAISFTQALTLNTNGALVLQGGDTAASGVGITFPATQSASSDANTLDDYEEGTWTPIYTGGGVTPTYSEQTGRYIKIGQMVYISFRLVISASSGGSGALKIGGLPFTTNVSGSNPGFIALNFSYGWNSAEAILSLIPTTNATALDAYTEYAAYNANTQTTVAAINAGGTIYIIAGGCYQAAN
jgi:hypothetical protein